MVGLDWIEQGKCQVQGVPSGYFYPTLEEALALRTTIELLEAERATFCQGLFDECPVRRECLEYAKVNREKGVWGGTTEKERNRLRRRDNAKKKALLKDQIMADI